MQHKFKNHERVRDHISYQSYRAQD